MSTKEITRKELYELVWQKPMIHLAKDLHLSDVGLAKICKKYDIPRPPAGYWAQIQHNWRPKQTPLSEGEDVTIYFDLEENKRRREQHEANVAKTKAVKAERKELEKKGNHPLGERVNALFAQLKPGKSGRVRIKRANTPNILASPETSERIVRFLSLLAHGVEKKGITLVSGNKDSGIRFEYHDDVLHIQIEEDMKEYELEPTEEQKRLPAWKWDNKRTRPCGKLRLLITSPQGTRGRCRWAESDNMNLEYYLPPVLARIESVFEYWESEREKARIREEERKEEERRWEENQRIREHNDKLIEELGRRRRNLILAAEQYQTALHIKEFISATVESWKSHSKSLSRDQKDWIEWAERTVSDMNPISHGFPDPNEHGGFDPGAIPIGGPYPKTKDRDLPYLIAEIKSMVSSGFERQRAYYGYRTW